MNINYNFFENLNKYKIPIKTVKLYFKTIKPLIETLKKFENSFNLLYFINDYDEIINYLNRTINDKKKMLLVLNSILYIIQYFEINNNYISIDKYNEYKNKYLSIIKNLNKK